MCAFKSIGRPCGVCPQEACASDTDLAMAPGWHGGGQAANNSPVQVRAEQRRPRQYRTDRQPGQQTAVLDHEAVLLPVMGHKDNIPVGSPDEAGQPEGVVGARRCWLYWRNLVGLNAAQLRCRVQHANASQE